MWDRVNFSGLVIAGIGFFVTRLTVNLTLYTDPTRFFIAGIVPLAIGLGLAAFGVALVVVDIDPAVVRTTAFWCLLGTASMFIFAVLTLFGSAGNTMTYSNPFFSSYLSNFLIGGSVGGTLTGLYASRNRQQRQQLRQHSNRLVILNRMLRHEVLNALTAIRGFASLGSDHNTAARDVVRDRSVAIEGTIEDVKYLTRKAGDRTDRTVPMDLDTCIESSIATVSERHPNASVSVRSDAADVRVLADEQLTDVFVHLLENAIVHADDETPTIAVSRTKSRVRVSVIDEGHGLPTSQQRLLDSGDIEKFDNPETGFGLNLVRLYVEEYDGLIETNTTDDGTTISIVLSRATSSDDSVGLNTVEFDRMQPAIPHFTIAVGVALIAGLCYGISSEVLGGSIAGIGLFYGTVDTVVGWITHEFHSIVFGFVFIGLVSLVPERWPQGYGTYVGIGIVWSFVLWVGAAGFIAPIWLQLSGIPAPIPNLSGRLLVSHLAWGISLGFLTAVSYRHLLPWFFQRFSYLRNR